MTRKIKNSKRNSIIGTTMCENKAILGKLPPQCTKEDIMGRKRDFDRDFWPMIKQEVKDMTKKEACFTSFLMGFELMKKMTDEQLKEAQAKMSKMTPEEINKMLQEQ